MDIFMIIAGIGIALTGAVFFGFPLGIRWERDRRLREKLRRIPGEERDRRLREKLRRMPGQEAECRRGYNDFYYYETKTTTEPAPAKRAQKPSILDADILEDK